MAEIRFEELEAHPLAELRRVYTHLGLDGFEVAEPVWRDYLARQKTYQKNAYSLRRDTIDTIYRRWHFTIDQWHYEVPPDLLAPA